MAQAIITKYFGATNHKPAKIKATSASGQSVTLPYRCQLDELANHRRAARALCAKLGWKGRLAHGETREGFVFVFTS